MKFKASWFLGIRSDTKVILKVYGSAKAPVNPLRNISLGEIKLQTRHYRCPRFRRLPWGGYP